MGVSTGQGVNNFNLLLVKNQDPSKPALQAVVTLMGEDESAVKGDLMLSQWVPGGPVVVYGNLTGLPPGLHGLQITTKGDIREGCKSIGDHYNPYLVSNIQFLSQLNGSFMYFYRMHQYFIYVFLTLSLTYVERIQAWLGFLQSFCYTTCQPLIENNVVINFNY